MCEGCDACDNGSLVEFDVPQPDQDIMFLGEAPGKEEIKRLKCFVGASGKFLRGILGDIGILERSFFANSVKCLHKDFSKPSFNMLLSCSDYLTEYVMKNRPKYIVCLGDISGISAFIIVGRIEFLSEDYVPEIYQVEHPAYILRKNSEEEKENFKEKLVGIFITRKEEETYGICDILGVDG